MEFIRRSMHPADCTYLLASRFESSISARAFSYGEMISAFACAIFCFVGFTTIGSFQYPAGCVFNAHLRFSAATSFWTFAQFKIEKRELRWRFSWYVCPNYMYDLSKRVSVSFGGRCYFAKGVGAKTTMTAYHFVVLPVPLLPLRRILHTLLNPILNESNHNAEICKSKRKKWMPKVGR